MQQASNPETVSAEINFRCADYWTLVASRHERHGRGEQAKRLFVAAERMQRRGIELVALRLLCTDTSKLKRHRSLEVTFEGATLVWVLDWLDRGLVWQRKRNGR